MVDNGMGEKTQTKIPINVLWYMPIVPRLQRVFMVEEMARQMTWHKTGKRTELDADGNVMMVHTSDGEAWKRFDALHKEKRQIQGILESPSAPMGSVCLV